MKVAAVQMVSGVALAANLAAARIASQQRARLGDDELSTLGRAALALELLGGRRLAAAARVELRVAVGVVGLLPGLGPLERDVMLDQDLPFGHIHLHATTDTPAAIPMIANTATAAAEAAMPRRFFGAALVFPLAAEVAPPGGVTADENSPAAIAERDAGRSTRIQW